MARPSKDAFLAPPKPKAKTADEGEGQEPERTTKNWTHRLIVDGVEVDPKTMIPLNPPEE